MTPTIVHRYEIPAIEAVQAVVDIGDCLRVDIRLKDGVLVVDVVEPAHAGRTIEVPNDFDHERLCAMIEAGEFRPSNETAKSNAAPEPAPAEPERKGGRLAQQAAIACGERGFWSFLARGYGAQVETPDEARAWLCHFCGVSSRADLDHELEAGKRWREVQQRYRLWLDGYDD